jgi:hypothetical protein
VENKSENELRIFWEGPRFTEGTNDRITGYFPLPHIGSKQSQAFVDLPDRPITGKSGLLIAGLENPLKFILRLKFSKKVNGSLQIHHKSADL